MSNCKWTHELVKEEALKYNIKIEFSRGSSGAYNYAKRNGILDEVCGHMVRGQCNCKWTHDLVKEEALKYNSRWDFQNGSNGAYGYALKHNMMDGLFPK